MRTFILTVLVSVLTLTSCAKPGTDRQNLRLEHFTASDGTTREQVMLDPTDSVEICIAIDINSDGIADGVPWCSDTDFDLHTPATSTSPWGDDLCHCLVDGYGLGSSYISVASTAELDLVYDCGASDPDIYLGAPEVLDDGVDQDCDGVDSTSDTAPSPDTADTSGDTGVPPDTADTGVPPDTADTSGDTASDTASADPDADSDGYPASEDCNDSDADVHPGAVDIDDNGKDDDCDGEAQDLICVTDDMGGILWGLSISDSTVYPWTPGDPDWYPNFYDTGTGELCGSFPIVAGHGLVLSGEFDLDANGIGDYWMWELTATHVTASTIMGMDVAADIISTFWDGDGDGIDDGASGELDAIPTLPS